MPTYNYRCKQEECKHDFEATHKMNDTLPPCPKCKTEKPEKLISKSSFVLKGEGWFNSGGY